MQFQYRVFWAVVYSPSKLKILSYAVLRVHGEELEKTVQLLYVYVAWDCSDDQALMLPLKLLVVQVRVQYVVVFCFVLF